MSVPNCRRKLIVWSGMVLIVGIHVGEICAGTGLVASHRPMTITSETMIAQGKSQKAIFEQSVVLTREDMVIHADRMTVFFKKGTSGQAEKQSENSLGQQIHMVEAQGTVIIERADGKSTSGHAVYYKDEEKVVLTESPVAWQHGTRVTGTRMTIYLKEDRSVVEGKAHVMISEEEPDGQP